MENIATIYLPCMALEVLGETEKSLKSEGCAPKPQSGRRRGCPRRPPTPPYERFRIRRFLICVCIINQQCLTSYKHPALPHDFWSLLPAFRPSCEASAQNVQKSGLALHIRFSPSLWWLGQLLWRLLTSVGPSMYLTMHLAQGRPTDLPG